MRQTPRPGFAINLDGVDITTLPVLDEDLIGVSIDQVQIPGMVLLYEEEMARNESGYSIKDWYEMSPLDRAEEVALHRINRAMEYQRALAERRRMRQGAK